MDQEAHNHISSSGRTSYVPSLGEVNAQIKRLANMVKKIKDMEEDCLVETTKLRKEKKRLIRELELLDVASELLRHERDHFSSLLTDEQLAREQAEKENRDLKKDITELKRLLKVEKQKIQEFEKVAGMKEKLEALRKAMDDVLV